MEGHGDLVKSIPVISNPYKPHSSHGYILNPIPLTFQGGSRVQGYPALRFQVTTKGRGELPRKRGAAMAFRVSGSRFKVSGEWGREYTHFPKGVCGGSNSRDLLPDPPLGSKFGSELRLELLGPQSSRFKVLEFREPKPSILNPKAKTLNPKP